MEEETYQTCVDPSLQILEKLLDDLPDKFGHLKSPIQTMILDLRLFELPMEDGVAIFHEGLLFLVSFVVDPPKENSEGIELILTQIYAIINQLPSLICSTRYEETKDQGISEAMFSAFLQKIDGVKAEVTELYVKTQQSSQFNSPQIYAGGFLDSLLGNLKKMLEEKVNLITLVKHRVELVHKELVSLRPFLENIMELQHEHEEMKNLSTRIINVVYNADYVIKLRPLIDIPVWYSIICLCNVMEEIKFIKFEVKQIEADKMYNHKKLTPKMKPSDASSQLATTSEIKGAFIGFEKDAGLMIDYLTRGREYLTIISISGLPGQGKTTLAKRVYNDPKIQYHFRKIVWCYVSKDVAAKELLIKIIHEISGVDVKNLKIQDLIEHLRKSLKRKRYLIVMDDIWDVNAWREIEGSFPDDNNGSRIIFTSRNHDLASQAKSNSISHPLPVFSDEDSWELMKEKLFHHDGCPQEFRGIGQQIASYCKGLPLAVVLIAEVLRRVELKFDLWKEVVENLKSHLASEGCRSIIELSYKYLPDNLRPCFLYFGAFPRGANVRAKKLKLLWIAEGFIKDSEMQCSGDLANEYLDNLVSKNLVVVTQRSSTDRIKMCNVHDLLYDLCLEKAKEENFLQWAGGSLVVNQCYSNPQKYSHDRLCIGKIDPFIKPRPTRTTKELPTSWVHSLLSFGLGSYPFGLKVEFYFSCFLESFKVLTVLDLVEVDLRCSEFPQVIFSNIHLRYLALSSLRNHGIPASITNLWNLETLIVTGLPLRAPLPASMWKMKSLRHIIIPRARLYMEDFEGSNSLTAYNIETVGQLFLEYNCKTQEFLRKFQKLRKLSCYFEDKEFHPMWFSMFESLINLKSLRIERPRESCSEGLPTFNFPENLKKLTLDALRLPWSAMSEIGKQLPNLEVLKLLWDACSGTTWNLEDGDFSNLKYLRLQSVNIGKIDVSYCNDTPFPCLEQLVVDRCYYLKEIPSGFAEILTLKTIRMIECPREATNSARQILENQQEMGNNDLQVFIKDGDESGKFKLELPDSLMTQIFQPFQGRKQ